MLEREVASLRSAVEGARAEETVYLDAITAIRERLDDPPYRRSRAPPEADAYARLLRMRDSVFQIAGKDVVGSAVLVDYTGQGGKRTYYALTSHHVVRDILEERAEGGKAAGARAGFLDAVFERDDQSFPLSARIAADDEANDLAVLTLETDQDMPFTPLAPAERLLDVRPYAPVVTFGCPLGMPPQGTRGEITSLRWLLDDRRYWIVSSPAYFGNSGGGVFLEETGELAAIFAKIYTHGSRNPQVITHLGLAVPLPAIRSWLDEAGYAFLLDGVHGGPIPGQTPAQAGPVPAEDGQPPGAPFQFPDGHP